MNKYFLLVLFTYAAYGANSSNEVLKGTLTNIKGHEYIYTHGLKFVTSSEKTFRFINRSLKNVPKDFSKIATDTKENSNRYKKNVSKDLKSGLSNSATYYRKGRKVISNFDDSTSTISKKTIKQGSNLVHKSWKRFTTGYLQYGKRTEQDRASLKEIPGNFFKNLKKDFSNLKKIVSPIKQSLTPKIKVSWKNSFKKASNEFTKEYQKSGTKKNSLSALGNIIAGYAKAFYYALFRPASQSTVKGGTYIAKTTLKLLGYPIIGGLTLTKNTVTSIGATLVYTSKGIYHFLTPTIEAGILTALGVAEIAAGSISYASSKTLTVIGHSTIIATTPVVGAVTTTTSVAVDSADYAVTFLYNVTENSSKAIIRTSASAIALGYNAITAIPTHLLLATINVGYFLVWDGPRLAIYAIKGPDAHKIPAGVVIDIKKIKETQEFQIEELKIEPFYYKQIINNLGDDLREINE